MGLGLSGLRALRAEPVHGGRLPSDPPDTMT